VRGYLVAASARALAVYNLTHPASYTYSDTLVNRLRGAPRFVLTTWMQEPSSSSSSSSSFSSSFPSEPSSSSSSSSSSSTPEHVSRWLQLYRHAAPALTVLDDRTFGHTCSFILLASAPTAGLHVFRTALPILEGKSGAGGGWGSMRIPLYVSLLFFFDTSLH
jgi:hypothetical protein